MILNGNQRGGAKDLALHLMKDENEIVELHELRGFMSSDLMGALNEIYAISRATQCSQFMYSLSLNPPPHETVDNDAFKSAIEEAEKRLGLQGQPRAIVFHEKHGRRHAHVVWSRIDIDTMTAQRMSYDREILTTYSRELFLEHSWEVPKGLINRKDRNPTNYTHAEYQQAQRMKKNAAEIKRIFQEAWEQSDSRISFEHALAEKGYYLARGDKGRYVAVDIHGEIYSVPKQLPKGINTKHVRAKLGESEHLPSIDEVRQRLAQQHSLSPEEAQQPEKRKAITPQAALEHVMRYHAAFTRKMAERSLYARVKNESARQTLIDDMLKLDDLKSIGTRDNQPVYSTGEMMTLEQSICDMAASMADHHTHHVHYGIKAEAISNLNATLYQKTHGNAYLSDEQRAAITHMTQDQQLSLLVGVAGAGKTTIMAGAKDAYESQGYRVRGAAPSGIAASGLKEIGMNASTLHSLEYRIEKAQELMDEQEGKPLSPKQREFTQSTMLTSKDVLIVDEAGMVSAKQLVRVMELCQQSGAKLVLVGDPEQLQSIEAGAAFRTLLERHDAAHISEVRRQNTGWQRDATIALSQGNTANALRAYQKHDCLHHGNTRSDAKEKLVADMMASYRKNPNAQRLVLAYTRKDVADLNTMIKAEMVSSGAVSDHTIDVQVTMTDGDVEYQAQQEFAVGDRLLFRENDSTLGVMNGSFGTLRDVTDGRFSVELDSGNTVSFSTDEYNHLQLGYATTIHKSQGMTVDECFVLATPHFDKHTSYVAMSRHKQTMRIYASKEDFKNHGRLCRTLGKDSDALSTLDFTDRQPSQKRSWFQRIAERWKNSRQKQSENDDRSSHLEPEHQPDAWIASQQRPASLQERNRMLTKMQQRRQPDKAMKQQYIRALRDQFMQEVHSTQSVESDHEQNHDHGPSFER